MYKFAKNLLLLSILTCLFVIIASSQDKPVLIEISLKHDSDAAELQIKNQLQRLMKLYDVSKWIFTKNILVDRESIPHSHPVLTLHTRHLKDDELLLSTFVHEQIHWFMEDRREETQKAIAELKTIFPKVPVGYPEGAQDEESAYLHLLVCYSEYKADKEIFGELKARQIMEFWASDHYTWIYKQILGEEQKISRIIRQYKLAI